MMRISLDERIDKLNERRINYPKHYLQLNFVDVFTAIDVLKEGKYDAEELTFDAIRFLTMHGYEEDWGSVTVGELLSPLLSLHRKYGDYNEREKRLINVLLGEIVF
ncbi:MAG: hypothetical protein IJ224_04150 [Lachnospiraceae bacterium]|nr:hypothetical protein [Lachnospiraceae bacterium]